MKKQIVYHPIFLSLFPAIFLFANNYHFIELKEVVLPTIILETICILIWLFLSVVLKNLRYAGAIVSLSVLMFFLYNTLEVSAYQFFHSLFDIHLKRRVVLGSWIILFIVGQILLFYFKSNLNKVTRFLNFMSIILLVISSFQIIAVSNRYNSFQQLSKPTSKHLPAAIPAIKLKDYPDIYYILLDAYAGSDVLQQTYNYDNSDFINHLKAKGFYIPPSVSNYAYTQLSIPSSLNMEYINYFDDPKYLEQATHGLTLRNNVTDSLRKKGYSIITVGTKNLFSDTCIYPSKKKINFYFSQGLLEMTILGYFMQNLGIALPALSNDFRNNIQETLLLSRKIPSNESPKFTYIYFLCPHYPFIFGVNGEKVSIAQSIIRGRKKLYADQVAFISSRIDQLIDTILVKSKKPPIIIIQGDHGHELNVPYSMANDKVFLKQRFRILNAYYIPTDDYSFLHKGITPVNSFRHIFNYLFDSKMEILPDSSYINISRMPPYQFVNVTNIVRYNQ